VVRRGISLTKSKKEGVMRINVAEVAGCPLEDIDADAIKLCTLFVRDLSRELETPLDFTYIPSKVSTGARFGQCDVVARDYNHTFTGVIQFSFNGKKTARQAVGWKNKRAREGQLEKETIHIAEALRQHLYYKKNEMQKLYEHICKICNVPV